MTSRCGRRCGPALALVLAAIGAPPASARDEKVVAAGDVIDGWTIDQAQTAQLNLAGQVAFVAASGDDSVLFLGLPDVGFADIAHTGTTLLPRGGTLASISQIDLGERDDVAVRCGVDVGEPLLANCALRANLDGVTELFRGGEPAPGGVAFGSSSLQMLRNGRIAFGSPYGTGGMATGLGIFLTRFLDAAGLDAAALKDQPHAEGGVFKAVGQPFEGILSSVVFSANASFDGLNNDLYSLWRGSTSQPAFLIREGQELSATTSIGTIESVAPTAFSASQVVVAGTVVSGRFTRNAITLAREGSTPEIYNLEGDADPEHGEIFASFAAIPQTETAPYIAFRATMQNGRVGLFREGLAGRRSYPVARLGDPAPGEAVDAPYVYEAFWGAEAGSTQLIAFGASVHNDKAVPPEPQRRGVYIAEPDEALRIVRAGLQLGGETVTDATFLEANGQGQVLYRVDYASGGSEQRLFTPDLRWRTAASGPWSSLNWTLSLYPDRVHDVAIDPATDVTVTASSQAGGVRVRSLAIGGGAGVVTLHFPDFSELLETLAAPIHVLASGRITAETAYLRGGLRNEGIVTIGSGAGPGQLGMYEAEIENHGEIRGAGWLEAPVLTNAANATFVAMGGQSLVSEVGAFANEAAAEVMVEAGAQATFGGSFLNDGVVEVETGATATFEGLVTGGGSFTD
jgi:hypothetical protein